MHAAYIGGIATQPQSISEYERRGKSKYVTDINLIFSSIWYLAPILHVPTLKLSKLMPDLTYACLGIGGFHAKLAPGSNIVPH